MDSDTWGQVDEQMTEHSRVNQLLNPSHSKLTDFGRAWCAAIATIMLASAIYFTVLYFRVKHGNRFFHRLVIGMNVISAWTYMVISQNYGFALVPVHTSPAMGQPIEGVYRQVSLVRYYDWILSTPLMLVGLLLTAGLRRTTIGVVIFGNDFIFAWYLVAAVSPTPSKFYYFLLSTIGRGLMAGTIILETTQQSSAMNGNIIACPMFVACCAVTGILWAFFPCVWILCEGYNALSVNSETIAYSILDILAKPLFGALLLLGHDRINSADFKTTTNGKKGKNGKTNKKQMV